MSLPQFFLEKQVLAHEGEAVFALDLTPDDARHFKVARLAPGEKIAIIDAASDYFVCEIESIAHEAPLVRICARLESDVPQHAVTLFQGIPKADKMDEIVRHATEVGVSGFVPVAFSRSVSKLDEAKGEKKCARLRRIAKSAAMQAGRELIPEVSSPVSAKRAAQMLAGFDKVIIFWEEAEGALSLGEALAGLTHFGETESAGHDEALSQAAREACEGHESQEGHESCEPSGDYVASIAVVVGPEGGLSPEEVASLKAAGNATVVSLGENILRTETAAVVGSALVIYELGGLGNKRKA